jgi:hypothetical protein
VTQRSSIGTNPDHALANLDSMPPGPHSLARLRIWSGAKNQIGLATNPSQRPDAFGLTRWFAQMTTTILFPGHPNAAMD